MSLVFDFDTAHGRGVLFGQIYFSNRNKSWEIVQRGFSEVSLEDKVDKVEFVDTGDFPHEGSLFEQFNGQTSNATFNSVLTLEDSESPDYKPSVREYLKYLADRIVEEGHAQADELTLTLRIKNYAGETQEVPIASLSDPA